MRIWRICRRAFARKPLEGRGGLTVAGRWHTPSRLVAYASESLALASLEVLVHCDMDLLPRDLVAVEIEAPATVRIQEVLPSELPRAWRAYPAPRRLQEIGNQRLDRGHSAILRVPSVLVPTESNFLINPVSPEFRKLRVVRRFKFAFDERLGGRGHEIG